MGYNRCPVAFPCATGTYKSEYFQKRHLLYQEIITFFILSLFILREIVKKKHNIVHYSRSFI
ncbi:MAG TPA: hypothetical protein PLA91_00300 [Bacillota bacterium]|nr:hypothetical protein [Bacillota bacterium]